MTTKNDAKFKVGDRVRFSEAASIDDDLLSGLETDLLGEWMGGRAVERILSAIRSRKTVVVTRVDDGQLPHYDLRLGRTDMGAAFPAHLLDPAWGDK